MLFGNKLSFIYLFILFYLSSDCLFWSQLAEVSNAEDLDREKHFITGSFLVLSILVTRKILPKGGLRGGDGSNKRGGREGCSCKYHHQGVDGRIGAVWAGTSAPSLYIQFNLLNVKQATI
jgi:hypothetical protein